MKTISPELQKRLKAIRLIISDVDGVLTDGSFYIGENIEVKRFHSSDGLAFLLLRLLAFPIAIVSGRHSTATLARTRALHIPDDLVFQDSYVKNEAFDVLRSRFGLQDDQIAYIGDDHIDTPVMKRSGVAFAPANAIPEVRKLAHYVTETPGGYGALREIVDLILRTQGRLDEALKKLHGLY
ncbi:MAG: HAD hydrolase family protein [Candidatus Neomarinimicrobiota bacterium]|jgi:3-deoxy-D-manno-octulosonate 8-phosphate phosphatase (KDO 8-P phosphatase)|nr:HAD hydrolase family protein [Candidatus Neomarinimicrobiota bacterium]MDD3965493.1 HAD hydrolase family protein [Candidatus Neomarinimicrobiota bacterium]MDX9780156.1 HAD hydrolase family protein [bacterium]